MRDQIDWLTASREDRQALYQIVSRIVRLRFLTWNEFFAQALGRSPGLDYIGNFRRGQNSRGDCARMHRFIQANFPGTTAELDGKAATPALSAWDDLFENNCEEAILGFAPILAGAAPKLNGRVTAFAEESAEEDYYLALEARLDGFGACLKKYKKYWFPLALGDHMIRPIIKGRQWLTATDDGRPQKLKIPFERFMEVYVLIVSGQNIMEQLTSRWQEGVPLSPNQLEHMVATLRDHEPEWKILYQWLHYSPIIK